MDLKLMGAEATADERAAVDALLGAPVSSWEGALHEVRDARDLHTSRGGHEQRARRHLLLPALHAVQGRVGWISEGAMDYVCARLGVPPAEAWGVATFYALFTTAPRPRRVVHVCDDIACRCAGAQQLVQAVERAMGPAWHPPAEGLEVSHDPDATVWMRSPCLGLCEQAPAVLSSEAGDPARESLVGHATLETVTSLAAGVAPRETVPTALPQQGDPSLVLLARVGVVDPTSLDAYRANGGYAALRRAFELGPEGVLREMIDSNLVGRGGAAFPTGKKWEAVARAPERPHFLVCNADESEPGTFKDRVLLESDPFALVEGMTIAAFATGCEFGFVYVRGEYPLAVERLEHAIAQAEAHGLLGEDVMGRGVSVRLEVRKGAGAYICGEETALFNSIEGLRGEPRSKPPFPVQSGLFGKPTVVNNVETLCNVPHIVLHGGPAFARVGTAQSTGTKLYCVSGSVRRAGVYELPFGASLRTLLELAGGVPEGRRLAAVLVGGAAGVFVRPDELDIELSIEGARAAGATVGSGVVMAFDDTVDLHAVVRRIAAFFRDESCGQCVPCRVGTVRQEESLHRLARGASRGGTSGELALLRDVGQAMKDASICGLGQTAYSAVESAMQRLRLYES